MDMAQYLQASQAQGQMPQAQQPMMPAMGTGQMPPLAMNPMGEAATAATQSPIKAGTLAGMQAAKQSLEMNEAEKTRAIGSAMVRFFSNVSRSQAPSMLERMNESFEPAMEGYQKEQARIAQMKAYALDRQDKIEKQNRDFEELTAYQKAKLATDRDIAGLRNGGGSSVLNMPDGNQVDVGDYPRMSSTAMRTQMGKQQQFTSHVLQKMNEISKTLGKMENIEKGSLVSPYNPYSTVREPANFIKDMVSRSKIPGNKKLTDERLDRQEFDAQLETFKIEMERALRNGVVPMGMMQLFEDKKVYPGKGQSLDEMRRKFETFYKEAQTNHLAADLSLKSNRLIGPADVSNLVPASSLSNPFMNKEREENHADEASRHSMNHSMPHNMGAQPGTAPQQGGSPMDKIEQFKQLHPEAVQQGFDDNAIAEYIATKEAKGESW